VIERIERNERFSPNGSSFECVEPGKLFATCSVMAAHDENTVTRSRVACVIHLRHVTSITYSVILLVGTPATLSKCNPQ